MMGINVRIQNNIGPFLTSNGFKENDKLTWYLCGPKLLTIQFIFISIKSIKRKNIFKSLRMFFPPLN